MNLTRDEVIQRGCKCAKELDSGRIPNVCRFCWHAFWNGLIDGLGFGGAVMWLRARSNGRSEG